jgi:hypothetical protein
VIGFFQIPGKIYAFRSRGQILTLVLIFLTLGILMITPLLGYLGTGARTGLVYEKRTDSLYAADAGIEDAKWKIEYDKLTIGIPPSGYSVYDFNNAYVYTIGPGNEIGEDVNENLVEVKITNVWIPPESIIPKPSPGTAKDIIESNKLVVSGATTREGIQVNDPHDPLNTTFISEYKIKIVYECQQEDVQALHVKKIGVWLPSGFDYFSDPMQGDPSSGNPLVSSLELSSLSSAFCVTPETYLSSGGATIVWSYSNPIPAFTDYPSDLLSFTGSTYSLEIKFYYTTIGSSGNKPDAVAWIKTNGDEDSQVNQIPFSWNADVKIFYIQSKAGNTTVEAYVPKSEMRELSNTITGDYQVTGNSLMEDAIPDNYGIRDTWLRQDLTIPDNSSSNSIPPESASGVGDGIPINSEVKQAYLYWTSWFGTRQNRVPNGDGDNAGIWTPYPVSPPSIYDKVDETNPNSPNDSNYFSGVSSGVSETQKRFPGGDVSSSGPWVVYPSSPNTKYDKVNESAYDGDSTYLTLGATSGMPPGHALFSFSNFLVPSNATISSLTVGYYARDELTGSNNLRVAIRVGGTDYLTTDTGANPGTGYVLRTYNFTLNPKTGFLWTIDEINGAGSDHLEAFGINSSDANPPIRITQIYSQVNYVLNVYQMFNFSPYSIPSGATISDLTINIRARDEMSGANNIQSSIKVGGVYYNQVFQVNDPDSSWTGNTIPYIYTSNPATGLAWTVEDINGFGPNSLQQFGVFSSDLDPGIRISLVYSQVNYVYKPTADISVYFKIDDKLVYFNYDDVNSDGILDPVPEVGLAGNEQIIADESKIICDTGGFSYACRKDVTDLVLKFAEDDDGEIDCDGFPFNDENENDDMYHPGIARYTVGGVDGTLGDNNPSNTQLAHAGWALVIIYTTPSSYLNQIYLYDITNVGFIHAVDNTNVDFDGDGDPGGTLRGFIVPQRICLDKDKNGIPDDVDGDGEPEEENAAKLTVFVGEGDDLVNGDYIEFNGTCLADGTGSEGGDVWNGLSGMFAEDGVDIDTFYITWESNLLHFGDTSAYLGMHTGDDEWNLIFTILSFRSVPITGGTLAYCIR